MMWSVSGPNESNGRMERPAEGASVLANLPRTRPQRATARRAAARRSGDAESAQRTKMASPARPAEASVKPAKPRAKATASQKRATAGRPRGAVRTTEPVPRQGFESDGDRASGPVSPPGGFELVASAAELFGELAKSGLIGGERLLRDVLARLPGS
jgi:hypothetical protein